MLTPLAHAGHWAIYIFYGVPIVIVLASIVISARRERREAANADEVSRLPAP